MEITIERDEKPNAALTIAIHEIRVTSLSNMDCTPIPHQKHESLTLSSDATTQSNYLDLIRNLPQDDQVNLVCKLYDTLEDKSKVRNYVFRQAKKRKGEVSKDNVRDSKAARGTNFIFRGDLIPEDDQLFIDVEKITLKIKNNCLKNIKIKNSQDEEETELLGISKRTTHYPVAGHVALVNRRGDLILWAIIKWPADEICQYFPSITGINQNELEEGVSLNLVHTCLKMALKCNTLVGMATYGDLDSLFFRHDKVEDLGDFYRDESSHRGQPYGLKTLAYHLLGMTEFQNGEHTAINDARVTQKLYAKKLELIQSSPELRFGYRFTIDRKKGPSYKYTKGDNCYCRHKESSSCE